MTTLVEFATPFLGLDRSRKARPGAKDSKGSGGPNDKWFMDCYSHSNLSTIGVYITHKPISPNPASSYTDTSAHVGNNWTSSWPGLLQQGWGAVFIYAGYTTKTIVINAVVFLDNEGGRLALDTDLLKYYTALYDELRKPGPKECQPVRPGVYAWGANSCELLRLHPDLFVWWLDHRLDEVAVRKNDNELYPIPKETADFLYLEPAKFPIRSASFRTQSGEVIGLLPIGIQGLLNYGKDTLAAKKLKDWIDAGSNPKAKPKYNNLPNLPRRGITSNFLPMTPWDLDMSLVRDPRYPQASPRLFVDPVSGAFGRGSYVKLEKRMSVEVLGTGLATAIQGVHLEAEAPLISLDGRTIVSIGNSGSIVSSIRSNAGTWSPFADIVSITPKETPRRARALAGATLSDQSTHVFFVARDQTLHVVSRSSAVASWTGPTQLHDNRVHGFTTLVAVPAPGSGRTISLFHVSVEGLLSQSDFTPQSAPSVAPPAKFSYIEPTTAGNLLKKARVQTILGELCLGSALATIRPHPSTTLVFGVHRRTLLLTLFVHSVASNRWIAAIQLGTVPDHKVFAHSRLAASQPNPSNTLHVQIAAVTASGVPAIFNVVGTPSPRPNTMPTWGLAAQPGPMPAMQILPRVRPSNRVAPEPAGSVSVLQWSVNPFSDIHFGVDPTFDAKAAGKDASAERVVAMAGTGPDSAVGVLFRRISRPSEDWFRAPAWAASELSPTTVLH
ncbi:uncharacterized protein AB675_8462 [Cyphellophora attinorum]|uniref:Uncharacterized protein n=1 Tax=Cyphellophora attinorum TaxID=1664694 RepID=A0A0N1HW51_9EURO|nr:uncharacterized protein AB675_8462 [Phialophora attinorum]KPI44300.1 hypothetical protein AB675_8462 [Phialophora attinorum]